MAKPTASSANDTPAGLPQVLDFDKLVVGGKPGEGAVKLQTSANLYKPKFCQRWPIHGYLIDAPYFPEAERPFTGLLFRLLSDCVGVDSDNNLIAVPKGGDIILPATYQLQNLIKAAQHSEIVMPFAVKATKEIDIGGGQSMWEYEVHAFPAQAKPRNAVAGKVDQLMEQLAKQIGAQPIQAIPENNAQPRA